MIISNTYSLQLGGIEGSNCTKDNEKHCGRFDNLYTILRQISERVKRIQHTLTK